MISARAIAVSVAVAAITFCGLVAYAPSSDIRAYAQSPCATGNMVVSNNGASSCGQSPPPSTLNGIVAPTGGVGVQGDFYIDTASSMMYGPKGPSAWPSGVSLIGATGATGATGPAALTGLTNSFGGGLLAVGSCASGTAAVPGAATSMVAVANPTTYQGDGIQFQAYVSAANTVTVKACALLVLTPTATTYKVKVLQ